MVKPVRALESHWKVSGVLAIAMGRARKTTIKPLETEIPYLVVSLVVSHLYPECSLAVIVPDTNFYFSTRYETYNRGVMGVETNIAANKGLENEQYNLFIY